MTTNELAYLQRRARLQPGERILGAHDSAIIAKLRQFLLKCIAENHPEKEHMFKAWKEGFHVVQRNNGNYDILEGT